MVEQEEARKLENQYLKAFTEFKDEGHQDLKDAKLKRRNTKKNKEVSFKDYFDESYFNDSQESFLTILDSSNLSLSGQDEVPVLKIPLSLENILSLLMILVLTLIGTVYVWILSTRKSCKCRLCKGEFVLEECIASGGFGQVYLIHKGQEKEKFILKKLDMNDITELDQAQYESKQMRRLFHKNIVSYEDEFLHMEEGHFENKFLYIIVMEYCENGDLTDVIREHKSQCLDRDIDTQNYQLPEGKVMKLFVEVLEALRYIHSKDLIHRDIKSPNIFLTRDGTAKLGDFGLSIQGKSIKVKSKYSVVGTDCYLAPELHKKKIYQKGKASDVWATGCILLEMVLGTPLWELDFDLGIKAIEDPNYLKDFISEKTPQKYDRKLLSLLRKMLNPDPEKRISVEDIMKKKFIRAWINKVKIEKARKHSKNPSPEGREEGNMSKKSTLEEEVVEWKVPSKKKKKLRKKA